MASDYNHLDIERTWQERWEADGLYRSRVDWDRPKHYAVTMLPYPSGDLHMGHWYAMTPSDARARMMRMKGYNVLFPMGFDAFGLPAENAAVQRNIHPAIWTSENIERMRAQLRSMGAMFDWEREAVTYDPEYYQWTEWFFKQMFEHDIAYRDEAMVNWSPSLQTVLANEQVIDGKDERNRQPVIQMMMEQWFFAITRYADELLDYGGHRLAGADQHDATQLDRPVRGRRGHVRHCSPGRGGPRRHRRVHHPPGHAVGRHLHGPGPRTSAGRHPHHRGPPRGRRGLPHRRSRAIRTRADGRQPGEDRRLHRRLRDQPGQSGARSRSGSPTTSCSPTGPARSWPFPPTINATSNSPAISGSRSFR